MNKQFLKWMSVFLLLLSGNVGAQVAVNSVVAEDQVQFANNTNFEIGTLTIKIKLPIGKTTAKVTVTLPTGIEYVAGSAAVGANATSVALVTGSPISAPVFTLVGTPNTEVVFTIKRKITKSATNALQGKLLTDKVKAEVIGEADDEKDSNQYRVTPPVVTVQGVTAIAAAQIGVNTTTFSIRNTGVGAARTVFFSIDYPVGVTTVTLTPPTGVTLAQVGTVPTGFLNAGKPLYSLTKNTGFAGNELVTITEVFKIAPSLCGKQPKLGYVPYWGLSATELFGQNTKVDRDITVRTYEPQIVQLYDNNKVYFKYGAGLCAATGQKLGTFYGAFKNNSTDATIYNNKLKLRQEFKYFKVANFCIIAADGTKIPIAETSNDGSANTFFDFPTNAALRTTNAALTGKDIGFTDEDGDGYLDDLKPGTEIRVCYDLVSKGLPFACNDLFINPVYYFDGEGACGALPQRGFSQNTYVRAYTRTNKSIFPAQLLLNTPEKGYLSPGMGSVAATEQLQGQTNKTNNLRYHYHMQLPSGVGLKNVVFHYTSNDDFTDTTAPTISIGNIAAGGVLSWTTPDTPPALASGKERLWGHISFELELTNCTGMGASAAFPYTISMMNRNQDGTFCPIPIVCETATIAMGCSVPCTIKGPEMLSTKVERADNSYGWTDATMATRVQRANVSPEQRRKVLPLDTVEFFAEGKQTDQAAADNLFYYVAVKKNADLLPKSIKVKVGTHEMTLQATDSGVITRANDANANYYRWNLTDALPSGVLAAGQTFSVVATYQASNTTENQDLAEQSGITSYFYTLANKADTAISPQGYHTNALRCGVSLIPVFDFGRTRKWNNMNGFGINGCTPRDVGGYYIHLGRNQAEGSLLYEEYRPGILMKKIVLKMPLAYKITANPEYLYTANATQLRNNTSSSVSIPLNKWVETTEGDKRVYTYTNPTNTADPYFLRPGMIGTKFYNEWLRVTVQASCKSKEFTGTDAQKLAAATAADEVGYYQIEAEDFYYHYADNPTPPSTNIANNSAFLIESKPQLLIAAQGQGSTIRANRNEQSAIFALEARNNATPNTWVSIPDITGVEVQGLEEVDNAAGTTIIRTLTPVTSISGEKMFFLNQTILVGAANQKYYRLKFKLTNCSNPQLKFKVYAGWNCEGNPTQGYRATCDDTFLEYTVNIAQSKKEIEVGSNPTALPMCAKTPFSYIVKSTDEGDIFGANLVVTQQPGIIISDVKVEYPLGSGKVYNTDTPIDGKKIGVVTTTNKTTYKLSDILPEGSLPGSVSTNTETSQKFKVLFNVQPECDFVSGSSFDIDLEGNNLCGVPAIGPKVVAIVAGIQSATVNNYNVLLSSINYINGNANACDTGATYKVRVTVNSSVPSFAVGNDARLHIRFPQLYDIQSSDISVDRSIFPQSNPASNWPDPSVVSRTTVGSDNEIIMVVPAGMKDTHYFEVTVKIKQKANTLVDCTTPQNIKVLTTDKITGIPCAILSPPVCPALIVSTSPERTAVIKNDRAELSFAEVQATAVPSANKENLTIQYKIANAATASAAYNGQLVVSLYNDLNNNGFAEASEVLTTHTTTQTLGAGVTSTVQSFTYLADQSQVCRLRLSIRNVDNKCLCDDKDIALPTPTLGGNLVSNLTTCEIASVTFAYNTAAPVYDAYSWSPASYLSAANIPTPTFTYSGAKLTAPLTVTYTLTVKRTNGCESTQTVTVVVTPTTATPAPNAVNLCSGNTIQNLKDYLTGLVSGTLKVYTTASATTDLVNSTAITTNTTYYYSAQVTGQCESARQAILVKIVATPNVLPNYTYCAGTKVAALWDQIDPADSDRSLKIYRVASGGTPLDRNDLLQNGTYYIADSATNGSATPTCESVRAQTTVNITTVATPTVSATTTLCPTAAAGSVSFASYVTAAAGNTLRWYATATATVPLTATPTISTQVTSTTTQTAYVSQVTAAGCEGGRAAITLVVDDTTAPTLTAPASLVTDCHNAATNISTWLNSATATDSCGTVSLTNTYSAPADFCNVPNGTLTVSFVAKDLFGNTTTQTRTITLVSIKAENDTFTVTHGAVATTTTKTVLDNDKVGIQTATPATVSMTVVTPATGAAGSATPTLNADGTITVPAGTKSGTYTITYKICTKVVSLTVCDSATATIVVGAPEIKANADTFTITNGATGGTTSSVLTNDSLNGHLNPSTTSVTLTWLTVPAGVQTHTDGTITVPAGTASGTYTVTYSICEKLNPSNCSTATATIVVGAPAIVANTDTLTIANGANGGTTNSVLTNDSLNGHLNPSTTSVTLTWLTVPSGVQTHTDGTLTVPAGTASGTYTVTYSICEVLNPSNCSTATATIVVGAPAIVANTDTLTIANGANGGTTNSVLTNDSLNGHLNPSTSSVTLTWLTVPAGVQTHTDGTLTVPAGTASGTYTVTYSICEKLNPSNCSTATATIAVGAPTIIANTDTFTITNGANGGTTSSVLINDSLNGHLNPSTTSVTLTWLTVPAGVQTHTDGTLTVPAGTASGTYTVTYSICEVLNPSNCSTATATIVVGAPAIVANTDTFTITNGANGGTTSSVLTNDSLNGHLNPSTTSVTLTWLTVPTGIQTHTDGTLTVPAGTASGTYTVTYSICEVLNPSNCSTATATIAVGAPAIIANTDTFTITNGANGGTTSSVLINDSLNGHLNPSTTSVTLTWLTVPAGVQTHTDGTLTVPAGTASGTYTVTYSICEVLNPSNCSTATATIVVHRTPAPIPAAANDEATTPINTPIVIDVLHNDSPHGTVTPHITTIPTNGTAVVNHDNTVTYTPNTNFVGIDTFVYEICNTDGVCVSATVTVKVTNGLTIYNAININGNSQNDHFHIGGIENYPNNTVRIFNRWGVKVFDTEGYDNVRNVFKGFSNGRVTVEGSENLPQGTYYYIIEYIDENGQKESKVGWLYLKK
nr:gliding motility-associated C-terminal domain-containing protein [uncultured Capnocytophaga sp.]